MFPPEVLICVEPQHCLLTCQPAPINLAPPEVGAKVVAASSNVGGEANDQPWGADSAIDGSRATAWPSNGVGKEAFIEIEPALLN